MSHGKPACGAIGIATDDALTTLLAVLGALGTIIGLVAKAIATAGESGAWTFLGVSAASGIWVGAAVGAALILIVVAVFYWKRCGEEPAGFDACSAGVVEEIAPSFGSAVDEIFPFTAMHDRVDIVLKSIYWDLISLGAAFVKCNDDQDSSPLVHALYKSNEVCGAGAGATIGAAAGALPAVIIGAAAAAALIGCATVILCIFAILLAAIIAAVVVLVAALIGGQIGKAVAGNSQPTGEDGAAAARELAVGDYVTTKGHMINSGDFDGARVYWFVNSTALHGNSPGSPAFSFTDPDANLNPDACPVDTILL